jgi:hypothetical protein
MVAMFKLRTLTSSLVSLLQRPVYFSPGMETVLYSLDAETFAITLIEIEREVENAF